MAGIQKSGARPTGQKGAAEELKPTSPVSPDHFVDVAPAAKRRSAHCRSHSCWELPSRGADDRPSRGVTSIASLAREPELIEAQWIFL
jgi:hypothetical protein